MKVQMKVTVEVSVDTIADAAAVAAKVQGLLKTAGTVTSWSEKVVNR